MTETASAERPPAAMRHRSIGPVQKALRFAAANKMLVAGGVMTLALAALAWGPARRLSPPPPAAGDGPG